MPYYPPSGAGPPGPPGPPGVVGPGTPDQLAKFTGVGSTVGDSLITDNGAAIQVAAPVTVIASILQTIGGGGIYAGPGGDLRTDTLQHSSFPGGATPINVLVPINVEAGTPENFFGTTGDSGAIFLDAKIGNQKSIGFGWNTNALDQSWINRVGYLGGVTQPRDLFIGDGQGNVIATFTGATKGTVLGGIGGPADPNSVSIVGGLTVQCNAGEYFKYNNGSDGAIYFKNGGVINSFFGVNGYPAGLTINDTGYLDGITHFRDFTVNNGKGANVMVLKGDTKLATFFGSIDMATSLLRGGTQVVGAQQAAVADAAGGVVVDVEARAAINALLARLRTHGLIAP